MLKRAFGTAFTRTPGTFGWRLAQKNPSVVVWMEHSSIELESILSPSRTFTAPTTIEIIGEKGIAVFQGTISKEGSSFPRLEFREINSAPFKQFEKHQMMRLESTLGLLNKQMVEQLVSGLEKRNDPQLIQHLEETLAL
jgi:hypothetical protein